MTGRTVHIVDDDEAVRNALRLLLAGPQRAVSTFASGRDFLAEAKNLPGGCLLLDIRMPDMDGLEVQHRLADIRDDFAIVMMTGHGDLSFAANALRNGAVSFIEKPFARATVERALEAAFQTLEREDGRWELQQQARAAIASLDPGERAILARISAGQSSDAIAVELGLSLQEVELRRAKLFGKLGIASMNEAFALACRAGEPALRGNT